MAADVTRSISGLAVGPLSSLGKMRLAAEVVGGYMRVRRSFRGRDLRATLGEIRDEGLAARMDAVVTDRETLMGSLRIARAVRRTLPLLPADSRCLMQSLVVVDLLARRGVRGDLVIGVRPGEAFAAHAWVELDGIQLLPAGEDEYRRLAEL